MMTFALEQPLSLISPVEEDRALGQTGMDLRALLEENERTRSTVDRGQEIYHRVSTALHRASADGIGMNPDSFSRTLELLAALPHEIPLPDVVVESENEIGLDWDRGRRQVLTLTVRDTPLVGYAGLFGEEPMHGRMGFAREMPQTLRFLLTRLFQRPIR